MVPSPIHPHQLISSIQFLPKPDKEGEEEEYLEQLEKFGIWYRRLSNLKGRNTAQKQMILLYTPSQWLIRTFKKIGQSIR